MFFNQIEYDDLDPEVMAMGRIENGVIRVGRAAYTTLIVPPIPCIEKYALDLILKFKESGGKVIFAGLTPYEKIEDDFDPAAAFEAIHPKVNLKELYFGPLGKAEVIQKSDNLAVLIAPGGLGASCAGPELAKLVHAFAPAESEALVPEHYKKDIIVHRREKGDFRFIMLASQNGDAADTKVLFRDCPEGAAFYELDLETGTVSTAAAEKSAQGCLLDAALSPWTARIFVMAKAGEETSHALTPVQAITRHPAKTLRLGLDLPKELPVSIQGAMYTVWKI